MKVNVKLFGMIAENIGKNVLQCENLNDTSELIAEMKSKYPSLAQFKYVIAVNKKIVSENIKLSDGDEVALLPPFAGG